MAARAERHEMKALSCERSGICYPRRPDDPNGPAVGRGGRLRPPARRAARAELVGRRRRRRDADGPAIDGAHETAATRWASRRRDAAGAPSMLRSCAEALRRQKVRQEEAKAGGRQPPGRIGKVGSSPTTVGRPLNSTIPSGTFRIAADKLGLTGIHFHSLRHTNASVMLNAGVALKTISENLGHSTWPSPRTRTATSGRSSSGTRPTHSIGR